MPDTWVRTVLADLAWTSGYHQLASVPRGDTLLVVRFGWGFYGDTSSDANLMGVSQNLQVMGLVTTVGTGSETPPNARTQSSNQNPPTGRWIDWEVRAPLIAAYDSAGGLTLWQYSGSQAPVETKGMVSAKTIPAGDTLNLWASCAAAGAWDSSGSVDLWLYASIAYKPSS